MSASMLIPPAKNGVLPLMKFSVINGEAWITVSYDYDGWKLSEEWITKDYQYNAYENDNGNLAIQLIPCNIKDEN